MEYFSTRDSSRKVTASQAIAGGLAPDGGLYVPSELPGITLDEIKELCAMDYRGRAARIIAKFMPEYSSGEIRASSPPPTAIISTTPPSRPCALPTATPAFWSCGTVPPAPSRTWRCRSCRISHRVTEKVRRGTAGLHSGGHQRRHRQGRAGGLRRRAGHQSILVFFPNDGVSDVQKLQMVTQSGGNVMVSAVYGNFRRRPDRREKDLRRQGLCRGALPAGLFLSSANSINWGRLLPQIVYYVSAYCDYVNSRNIKLGDTVDFAVPTGNFGDILAGWYAKKMGLPAGRLICCSNSNNVLTDFLHTGVYDRNRKFYTTISPSMDILVSSNLERLLYALCGSDAEVAGYMKRSLPRPADTRSDPR
jgi:threonine synthase